MARRRSNHEGTIYKLANGSFRVQIRLNGERLSITQKLRKNVSNGVRKQLPKLTRV